MKARFSIRPDGEVRLHVEATEPLDQDFMVRLSTLIVERGGMRLESTGSEHGADRIVRRDIVLVTREA